jgi:predicted enzyme related to lactoylglutathione lyase
MSKHRVVHVEIPSKNRKKNSKFYQELFGWKLTEYDELDYTLFDPEEGPGGGFPPIDGKLNKIDRVLVYFSSEDIEADLKKVETLGGKQVLGKTEIPGQGWFGVFTDPDGNTVCLYTGMNQS